MCWGVCAVVVVVVVGGEVRAVPVIVWVVGEGLFGGHVLGFGIGFGF